MNAEENRAHVRKLFRQATKADVVEAARRVARYYQCCSRQGVQGDSWQHVFGDCLHMAIVDKRQKGKGRSGVDLRQEGESRDYGRHYNRFYVAS